MNPLDLVRQRYRIVTARDMFYEFYDDGREDVRSGGFQAHENDPPIGYLPDDPSCDECECEKEEDNEVP